jgi:hypothetical protein
MDVECASGRCADVNGSMICARQCDPTAGDCGGGTLCESDGTCGSCIPPELSTMPRPFGAPCDGDADCASMDCAMGEGGEPFCTEACTADSCSDGYHCRESRCVRGDAVTPGEPCVHTDDCAEGACVGIDGDMVCAVDCSADCDAGFECEPTTDGDRCVPAGVGLGEPCMNHGVCRTGLCAGTCTRVCDTSPCPDGFDCVPAGEVSGCFPAAEPMMPTESGGCAVGASGARGSLVAIALGLLLLRRRRS